MNTLQNKELGYFDGEHEKNNVFSFLEKNTALNPGKKVFHWVEKIKLQEWLLKDNPSEQLAHSSITLSEFTEKVKSVGAAYEQLGIGFGDRVVLFLPMGVEMYAAMFGLQMIGAIPVFLDTWARRGHLAATANVVDPVAMVSFQAAFEIIQNVPEFSKMKFKIAFGNCTLPHDANLQQMMQEKKKARIKAVEKEHTALITFTTGSSGVPKGADRSHRFLAAQHYAINDCLPYTSHDLDLPAFPVFSLNNIAAGVETVIPAIDVGTPQPFDGKVLLAQIEACKISCMTLSPSLLNILTKHAKQQNIKLPHIRRLAAGGAPISKDDVEQFKSVAPHCKLWVLYGSTEVEPIAHLEADEILAQVASIDPEIVEPGVFVGHYATNLKHKLIRIHKGSVKVENSSEWKNWEVGNAEPGELIVAGEHVCRSYFRNESAFATSKILDPDKETVWHRTGDIGQHIDGMLCIVGRVHNAIFRKNQVLFPVKPEVILKRILGIQHAGFLGIEEKTVVVFSLQPNYELTKIPCILTEIRRLFLKNKVPVDKYAVLESIPLDARHHSKVEYEVLRNLFAAQPELLKEIHEN